MFGKLIKHEFRASARIMLPIMLAVFVLALFSGVGLIVLETPSAPNVLNLLFSLVLGVFFISLFAICVVALVMMVQRFHQSLLSDEGYFSMCLPVSVDEHILSKLLVAVIWFILTGIVCAVCGGVMVLISSANENFLQNLSEFFGFFGEVFQDISQSIGTGNIVLYVLELILLQVLFCASVCLRFYSALAVGYSFSNHKFALSVVAFFVIGAILNTIQSFFVGVTASGPYLDAFFSQHFSTFEQTLAYVHTLFLSLSAYLLIISAIYYAITSVMMHRKLNLP